MNMKTLLCATLLLASAARSEEGPLAFIGTAELSVKVVSVPAAKWSFTLIDARSRVEYEESHIAGAINLPASQTQALLPKRIKDHARQIIFYCNGPKCTKSQKGARAAMALGYSSVLEYNEGLPAWGKASLPVEGTPLPDFEPAARSATDVARDLEKGAAGPFLLDIRDASEFAAFHVRGADNVALDDIASHVNRLPKGRTIVVMDHSGHQTLVAARLLHHLGFDKVELLEGGILGWQQQSLPTVIASAAR